MNETDPIIDHLVRWASANDDVRAMILTSTRAVPGAKLDALSDYDVILVLTDVLPYTAHREWIDTFGDVLVAYWDPAARNPETGEIESGNVVQYEGLLKIDFTLWSVASLRAITHRTELPLEFDAGYRVLLDKDRLTADLAIPSHGGYVAVQPDMETFLTLVNDFFIGVPYVAKCLVRDELLPAKWCLDYDMRYVYLVPMLEWHVAAHRGWHTPIGNNGKGLKQHMSPRLWTRFETTFAGADIADNWRALFAMIAFFDQIGHEVATALGFDYPHDLSQRVSTHAQQMRDGTLT